MTSTALSCRAAALLLAAGSSVSADVTIDPGAMGSGQYIIVSFPARAPLYDYYAQGTVKPGVLAYQDGDGHFDGYGNYAYASSGYDSSFFAGSAADPDAISLSGFATTDVRTATLPQLFKTTASAFGVILFTVTEPTAFSLTGSLEIDDLTAAGPGSINTLVGARLSPYNPFAPSLIDRAIGTLSRPGTLDLNQSGILEPGSYFFQAYTYTETTATDTSASFSAELTYNARIEFTPIPAPGSLTLLALAPLALARRRR